MPLSEKISEYGESLAILMICPQFHPLVGGYERAAGRLSGALSKAGMRVVVITERREIQWPSVEVIDGYEVRRLPCLHRRHLHAITSLLSFTAFLLRHGREFDVWHVHQYGWHAALAVALGKLLRRAVALKLTGTGDMGIQNAMGRGVAGHILRWAHRRVTACIAVSDETHLEAIRFGIHTERIHRIPNGVDGDQFYPVKPDVRLATRRALGVDFGPLVLYVGRMSPEKNPLGLLDAWAAVDKQDRIGAVLAMVGDGPEFELVQNKVKLLNLEGSVHLEGSSSDVAPWYRAADIYVISSSREGLSNTMIEAMATGLPVISTRVSGTSILLESPVGGVVVDVDHKKQLADAIQTLLRNSQLRQQLGENARLKFETQFSLKNATAKAIDLYNGLLIKNIKNRSV